MSVSGELPDPRDDPLAGPLAEVIDELFAPLRRVVDDPASYLDPMTAPESVLRWLAFFLGADGELPRSRRARQLAAAAVARRRQGTVAGMTALVGLYGGAVTIVEEPEKPVEIRVRLPDGEFADNVRDAIAAAMPVHVEWVLVFE